MQHQVFSVWQKVDLLAAFPDWQTILASKNLKILYCHVSKASLYLLAGWQANTNKQMEQLQLTARRQMRADARGRTEAGGRNEGIGSPTYWGMGMGMGMGSMQSLPPFGTAQYG